MKEHVCSIIETCLLWADVHLLVLDAGNLARAIRPGQFALARDPSTLDPYLRRTLWLYEIRDERVSFILDARDPLARRARVGDPLDVLAPLGRAIAFEPGARHVLLMGQGTRLAPLIAVAHEAIKLGKGVVLVSCSGAADSERDLFPSHLLAPEIEYSHGDGFDEQLIAWADAVVASGGKEFYRGLCEAIRSTRLRLPPGFARGWVHEPMPCGVGMCYACALETGRGIKLACVDGPALDLAEWERMS